MGRVVSSDHVHHVDIGPEGITVAGAFEGRAHDTHTFQARDVLLGEEEMVGRYFAGDRETALLGIADQLDLNGFADMAEVDSTPHHRYKCQHRRHGPVFGVHAQGAVLGPGGHDVPYVLKLLYLQVTGCVVQVKLETDHVSRGVQVSMEIIRGSTIEEAYIAHNLALGGGELTLQGLRSDDGRAGVVRHIEYEGEAARQRRPRACEEVFLVSGARVAQMYMGVDEAG
jgi:hypothetical protein